MTFSYSKDFSSQTVTNIENDFITKFLPASSGDAVRVYLYGLFLCNHAELDSSLSETATALNLSEQEVIDYFSYWEEFGLVSIVSKNPFTVQYLPVSFAESKKPRKIKAEKYTDFTKGIQALFPDRMISTSEYSSYFDIMETYSISPDAMLMIAKYCQDIKGASISYKYITAVAKDFGNRGIISVEKVENELSTYILHSLEIQKILKSMSLRKKPDIEDFNYYEKWTKKFCFEPENIILASSTAKKNSMKKLDEFMSELYSMKCFSKNEILSYYEKKQKIFDLTLKINRALSIYVDVLDSEIETYVNVWLSYGFEGETLIFIAQSCFKDGKTSLIDMDEKIKNLRQLGFIDLSSVNDYFESNKKADEFISLLLSTCGINRRPTPWDRNNLKLWKEWNFSEEMILEAGKLSAGKSSPIAYINGILSKWKNNGIYTVNGIESEIAITKDNSQEEYNREYERRRSLAVSRAQKNIEKAMEIEGFSSIYERLFGIEKDLAFAEISGNKDRENDLENEKIKLTEKANSLLSKIAISLDDLSPKYACDKCNDTGYVGTHRCDCYNKKV